MLPGNFLLFMYCQGIGQHRNNNEKNADLVCMPLRRKVCDVIEDKRWVTPIDPRLTPQREITFISVKVVINILEKCRFISLIFLKHLNFDFSTSRSDYLFTSSHSKFFVIFEITVKHIYNALCKLTIFYPKLAVFYTRC